MIGREEPSHDAEVDSHHWVPRQEGVRGREPIYVQACACGATYRDGRVVRPKG